MCLFYSTFSCCMYNEQSFFTSSHYWNMHWLFHGRGPYHVETSPLICSSDQWNSFRMIGSSAMRELRRMLYCYFSTSSISHWHYSQTSINLSDWSQCFPVIPTGLPVKPKFFLMILLHILLHGSKTCITNDAIC